MLAFWEGFLFSRKEKIIFDYEARFAQRARQMGNYSVLKTSILRAGTAARRLVVMCLYALYNTLQN